MIRETLKILWPWILAAMVLEGLILVIFGIYGIFSWWEVDLSGFLVGVYVVTGLAWAVGVGIASLARKRPRHSWDTPERTESRKRV